MESEHFFLRLSRTLLRTFLGISFLVFFVFPKAHAALLDPSGRHPSETLLQIFCCFSPLLKTSDVLDKAELDRILDPETDPAEISLENLNLLAQAVFKRPDNLERYQLKHSVFNQKFISYDTPKIRALFEKIGDINPILPSLKRYKYILLNGATIPAMRKRLKTFSDMVTTGALKMTPEVQVVFLTGDRDLSDSETTEVLLNPKPLPQDPYWTPPQERSQFPKTEYEAAQWIWAQTDLPPALRKVNIIFVNAPKKEEKRPDTLGTVEAWVAENPQPGHCLSLSNQPFVFYQELMIRHAFQKAKLDKKGFTVEGVGSGAEDDILLSILVDNLARTLFMILEGQQ